MSSCCTAMRVPRTSDGAVSELRAAATRAVAAHARDRSEADPHVKRRHHAQDPYGKARDDTHRIEPTEGRGARLSDATRAKEQGSEKNCEWGKGAVDSEPTAQPSEAD